MIRLLASERVRTVLVLVLLALAVQQLSGAALIKLKAGLAQVLIRHAWQETLDTGSIAKPWPWADTWPVMRLSIPAAAADLLVLRGAGGNALAFGPGYEVASVLPGQRGVTVIGGHRDTHFRFLGELERGDRLSLQRMDGAVLEYRISELRVIDSRHAGLPLDAAGDALLLVTCYPLDAVRPGGPLRYVVVAEPVPAASAVIPLTQGNYRL